MTYEYLKNLKNRHIALKLLNSDNFAFIVSFIYFVFNTKRHITVPQNVIEEYLEDFLNDLNRTYGEIFPKSAGEYLNDFTGSGYLKKYYDNSGEVLYEVTPYTQNALEFIENLEKSEFVGSRTKFNIIFELLEELAFETNLSDEERIGSLERQKKEIDKKIEKIRRKEYLKFDSSRIKEHYMQIVEQSRKLLYDFSQIEYNFRELNKEAAEQILSAHHDKERLLGSIFDVEEKIRESDQGKSFFAFWQILTDAGKNEQLSRLIENLYENSAIVEFDRDKALKDLKYDLLNNARKISKVTTRLIEQLRRFLDDTVWIEHKKILELCKSVQKQALEVRKAPPKTKAFLRIDGVKAEIDTVFEKKLCSIKTESAFVHALQEKPEEVDLTDFYHIFYVDEEELKRRIASFLQTKPQVSLQEITAKFPVEKGVSELVSYLSLAKKSPDHIVSEEHVTLEIGDEAGERKRVKLPKVIYTRERDA